MNLPPEPGRQFYKLHSSLLFYVNDRLRILDGHVSSPEEFLALSAEERIKVRDALSQHIEMIDAYAKENPSGFSEDELGIIRSWKYQLAGTFFILRYLKKHAVFLSQTEPTKAYGVLALADPFEALVGPHLPVMIQTVLLPFAGVIIYDGIMAGYRISFGAGIRRSLHDEYKEAEARYGLITSLPASDEDLQRSDVERLRFYLRSQRSREEFRDEIADLVGKSRENQVFYHQELGRIEARVWAKRLRAIGCRNAWFGILQNLVVASGKTKPDLERALAAILPPEKRALVYQFRVK